MSTYLASLGWFDWVCIAAGSWILLAVVAGHRIGKYLKHADDTQRATYPPPVPHPAVTQADIDATWLDAWPSDARWVINPEAMEQERYDRLFDDLIAMEGLQ